MTTDRVTKTLAVEVERHSDPQYGTCLDQGVKFRGIDGYWKVSKLADIYNDDRIARAWPPEIGKVFMAELSVKPAKKPNTFYHDIWNVEATTEPPSSWNWKPELSGSPASPPAGNPPAGSGGGTSDTRERSIERQVVVKAEAAVLAAALSGGVAAVDALWTRFQARCDELWNGAPAPAPAASDPGERRVEPEPEELDDSSIPF